MAFVVSILVLGTLALWLVNSGSELNTAGFIMFGTAVVIVAFGLYVGVSRLRSARRGEPAEDELSKRILQKASAISYYISLYLWVGMIYFSDKLTLHTHTLLGIGILGMAVIWVIMVIFFKIKGLKDV